MIKLLAWCALLGIIASMVVILSWEDRPLSYATTPAQPAHSLKDAQFQQFSEQGQLSYSMRADQIRYDTVRSADILLDAPKVIVFSEDGPPWRIQATHGSVAPDQSSIVLRGDVRVEHTEPPDSNYYQLRTEELTLYPEQQTMQTDKVVWMRGLHVWMKGVGMQGNWQQRKLELLREVVSYHEPAK